MGLDEYELALLLRNRLLLLRSRLASLVDLIDPPDKTPEEQAA